MLEEYRRRSPYIAYLVRSRQGLLSSLAALEKVAVRLENEQRMSSKFLITVCVRYYTKSERVVRNQESFHVLFKAFPGEERG